MKSSLSVKFLSDTVWAQNGHHFHGHKHADEHATVALLDHQISKCEVTPSLFGQTLLPTGDVMV